MAKRTEFLSTIWRLTIWPFGELQFPTVVDFLVWSAFPTVDCSIAQSEALDYVPNIHLWRLHEVMIPFDTKFSLVTNKRSHLESPWNIRRSQPHTHTYITLISVTPTSWCQIESWLGVRSAPYLAWRKLWELAWTSSCLVDYSDVI